VRNGGALAHPLPGDRRCADSRAGCGPDTAEYEFTLASRQEPSLVWWFRSLDDIVFAWR